MRLALLTTTIIITLTLAAPSKRSLDPVPEISYVQHVLDVRGDCDKMEQQCTKSQEFVCVDDMCTGDDVTCVEGKKYRCWFLRNENTKCVLNFLEQTC